MNMIFSVVDLCVIHNNLTVTNDYSLFCSQISIQRFGARISIREDLSRLLRGTREPVIACQVPHPLPAEEGSLREAGGRRSAEPPLAGAARAARAPALALARPVRAPGAAAQRLLPLSPPLRCVAT